MQAMVGVDGLNVVNHEWWDDDAFAPLGTLSAEDVGRLSGGRLEEAVPVRVNRLVVDSDVTVIVGPVAAMPRYTSASPISAHTSGTIQTRDGIQRLRGRISGSGKSRGSIL